MPTVAELLALSYNGSSNFAKDITAADYEAQYIQHGERVRWDKAIPLATGASGRNRTGFKYITQTLDEAARFMVWQTVEDEMDEEFGVIPKGTTNISSLPSWARFNRDDRVYLLDRPKSARVDITSDGTGTDALPFAAVRSISAVYVAGSLRSATTYQLTGNAIEWLSGAPISGTVYSVEFLYAPRFVYHPRSEQGSKLDLDGAQLPIRGILTLDKATGHDE